MPTQKPQILLTLDDDLLTLIDDYRYDNRIPSRSEAVRQLIKVSLSKQDTKSKPQRRKIK